MMIILQPQVEVSQGFRVFIMPSGKARLWKALREGLKPSNDWLKLHKLSWPKVTWSRSWKDTSPWGINFTGESWRVLLNRLNYNAYYKCMWFAKLWQTWQNLSGQSFHLPSHVGQKDLNQKFQRSSRWFLAAPEPFYIFLSWFNG